MGQPVSHSICCSVRDKETMAGKPPIFSVNQQNPMFNIGEVPIGLQRAQFISFAPLWQSSGGPVLRRRLAMANESAVHVYRLEDTEELAAASSASTACPRLLLEHKLDLPTGFAVSAMIFGERGDEGGSKRLSTTLVVAAHPIEGLGGKPVIKVWRCDAPSAPGSPMAASGSTGPEGEPNTWKWDKGFLASLKEHTSQVRCLSLSAAYLVTGDDEGFCRVWDKLRTYELCHTERVAGEDAGGLSTLVADRHFVYTVSKRELLVKVWTMPNLRLALRINTRDAIQELLTREPLSAGAASFAAAAALSGASAASPAGGSPASDGVAAVPSSEGKLSLDEQAGSSFVGGSFAGSSFHFAPSDKPSAVVPSRLHQIAQLTSLRRPVSRWSGAQPSKNVRDGGPPRGLLFVAGQLGSCADPVRAGSGFLMVWTLKAEPVCHSIEIAHDACISSVSYGPYDNGPLVTADTRGVFWIWDFAPRLQATQQVETGCFGFHHSPAMAVDPSNRVLFSIVGGGDNRLFVWRQQHSANPRLAPETN